jgi:hypothetical protein
MVPAAFSFLENLPLTENGKIDRDALAKNDRHEPRVATYLAPRSELEAILAGIWADVLHLARVGVQDNFFDLGGDSLLSFQIISRAEYAGIQLTPRMIFQHQTIADLAASLRARP